MTPTSSALQLGLKRAIDLLIASVALILLTPVFAFLALLIRITLGRPVFFVQERPGLGGVIFKIYKFRTMSNARNVKGELLPDELRLGKVGKLIRASSMDEVPQLLNVLNGDMSLVGPRPLLVEYLPLYSARQSTRHNMRPGITGLAQISGRNDASWESRLELDALYVENWNLKLDLKIMIKTFMVVARGKGVSPKGQASVEKFNGNEP